MTTRSLLIHFEELTHTCTLFADHLRSRSEQVQSALGIYASMPAIADELTRALYLLTNLEENGQYFQRKGVGEVAAFLPRNQLLYATVYMGVIPALMVTHCHVRPPESAHDAYRRLLQAVDFAEYFPNLHFFLGNRRDFVSTRARVADVVMFTGTYPNGESVRKQLREDALFLFSGAGHNPVIVRRDADLSRAAQSIVRLCYHNQGQDCSAPNAILADRAISSALFRELYERTLSVEAAMELGRHPQNMIAANTDAAHLVATTETFIKLQPFLVHGGELNTKTQMIAPTIFRKPLKNGPQLTEFFAPVIMLQEYDDEAEVQTYFNHPRYRPNAMYLTVFGQQAQIAKLGHLDVHPPETILHNTDLHAEEKGTHPYGGYGSEASFVYFAGIKRPTPILPQREIYEHLIAQREGDAGGAHSGRKRRVWTARDGRLERLKKLGGLGVRLYSPRFLPTASCRDLVHRYTKLVNGEVTGDCVTVAGRVVAYRNSGMFLELRDTSGKIQILCHESKLDQHGLELLKLIDLGDLLGVVGCVSRTRRGELTVAAKALTILAKDLLPPPHQVQTASGAGDPKAALDRIAVERQRRMLARSETVAAIRIFMNSQSFQDVETWALESRRETIPLPQGPGIATVPHFCRFLADGFADRCYEINGRIPGPESNAEQSIVVETAQAFADCGDIMLLTERLIGDVVRRLRETELVPESAILCAPPFTRQSVLAAIEEEVGVNYSKIESDHEAREHARLLGCEIRGHETWGQCVTSTFVSKVAARLRSPVHVTHLPKDISPSAVADRDDTRLAECFATYVNGRLIASGSTLLNDPFEYRERMTATLERAESASDQGQEHSEGFAAVLERGMPPAAVMRTAAGRLVSLMGEVAADDRAVR